MEANFKLHEEMLIHGELYYRLRELGIPVFMEVALPSMYHTSGFMRVDLAVIDGDVPLVAIEVKKEGKRMKAHCRQARAYRDLSRFNIAIFFINQMEEVEKSATAVAEIFRARRVNNNLPRAAQ